MHAVILIDSAEACSELGGAGAMAEICGLSLLHRHIRTLVDCGVSTITILAAQEIAIPPAELQRATRNGARLHLMQHGGQAHLRLGEILRQLSTDTSPLLIVTGDYLIEPLLVREVIQEHQPAVLLDTAAPEWARAGGLELSHHAGDGTAGDSAVPGYFGGLVQITREFATDPQFLRIDSINDLVSYAITHNARPIDVAAFPIFQAAIRRVRRGVWIPIGSADDVETAKRVLIDGAQKGSLDLPAQCVHAPIENWLIARICETALTPNQLTLLTNIMAWGVTAVLLSGHIIAGLIGAAAVGVMDGLDGKLARVKLMTSRIGELEHIFDLLFEYSWWFALGWVLSNGGQDGAVFATSLVFILANFGDSIAAVTFLYVRGRHLDRTLDNYTRTDYVIRKIAGRRNIYVWILLVGSLLYDPVTALYAATVWSVITVIVRGSRAAMHLSKPVIAELEEDFIR